jgi:TRAP transporter TAXI family solute receptor
MRGLFLLVLFLGLATAGEARCAGQIVVVGTAPVAGTYYPTGGALCRQVNEARAQHGLHCLVESTDGSEDNLRRLRAGGLDIALVQSDWQYYSARRPASPSGQGTGGAGGPVEEAGGELRAVFSLHAQPFTILASPESDIAELADLKGKRLNLGPAGSAQRAAGEALIEALGWQKADLAEVVELAADAQVEALCSGRIDAFLMPIGHPNGLVGAATDRCRARLVPVEGEAVDLLLASWPFYSRAAIPGGTYIANPGTVPSFGLRATLVTTQRLPEETVYWLVRSLFERIDAFRSQHPALALLDPKAMVSKGNTLALHRGALRYYRERGWK